MHFAIPLPWWVALVLAGVVGSLAFLAYRRPLAPLTRSRRATLLALRAVVLAAIVLCIFRPVVLRPPAGTRGAAVPVLVDVSRSMRLGDADGQARLGRAAAVLTSTLVPALSSQFKIEVFGVSDTVAAATVESLRADGRHSNLGAAVASIRDRYRGQNVAGIVLISDGADTGETTSRDDAPTAANAVPVFAIGVGSRDALRDREVVGITAGDQRLEHASVDLHVSAASHGFGRTPFQIRILANGRLVEERRVVPTGDGSPVEQVFTVFPDPGGPAVYTAEIPGDADDAAVENNTRSVLVSPAGRRRRLLVIEGAPGFEHTFMKRAWGVDPGLEVDSVVRKGKNGEGRDTFFVQASAGRAATLANGFPARREDLYSYDAVVLANIDADVFTRAQLTMLGDFVSERGGGLLATGGRSFAQRGLIGTPLEAVLPVELTDRRGGLVRASLPARSGPANKLIVTAEGEKHPIMRIGASAEATRAAWEAMPTLSAAASLGGPRPGATVLAVTQATTGGLYPVVAVQRYGRGRSMVFAGEASWRWKMMLPSSDRTYEMFWRQAGRWLAGPSPDQVTVTVPESADPGDAVVVDVDARDAAFAPVADAVVDATLTGPERDEQPIALGAGHPLPGQFTGTIHPAKAGLYRVRANARHGATSLGAAERWMYVGGSDREFADPLLNESFLRRMARSSGGRYVPATDAWRIPGWLRSAVRQVQSSEQHDLWDRPSTFAVLILALSAEWVLRRRWGLR